MQNNCCHEQEPNTVYFRQGDTFAAVYVYRVDNTPTLLEEGYKLVVGLYDAQNRLLKKGSSEDESIVVGRDNSYRMHVSHEESMRMTGRVRMEVTIADDKNIVVNHASEYVVMIFEPRTNNTIL